MVHSNLEALSLSEKLLWKGHGSIFSSVCAVGEAIYCVHGDPRLLTCKARKTSQMSSSKLHFWVVVEHLSVFSNILRRRSRVTYPTYKFLFVLVTTYQNLYELMYVLISSDIFFLSFFIFFYLFFIFSGLIFLLKKRHVEIGVYFHVFFRNPIYRRRQPPKTCGQSRPRQ